MTHPARRSDDMAFDPYTDWLGLPPGPRPPDPYALLGLRRFEDDAARIEDAAEESTRLIRRRASFGRDRESRLLLQEVLAARCLLVDPVRRREFDAKLRRKAGLRAWRSGVASVLTGRGGLASGVRFAAAVLVVALTLNLAWRWSPRPETADQDAPVAPVVAAAVIPVVASPAAEGPKARANDPTVPAPDGDAAPAAAERKVEPVRRDRDERSPVDEPAPAVIEVAAVEPVEAPRPPVPASDEYDVAGGESDGVLAKHVRDLLYDGFVLKTDEAAVLKHYRAADAAAPDDPRAEYALALVLWKRLKFDEAEARLAEARGVDEAPFIPARRAIVRLRLDRERRGAAIEEAVALADALGSAEPDGAARAARSDAAAWLGRLTAALESPWTPEAAVPQDVRDAHAAIRAALGPDLLPSYESGRRGLRDDYAARAAEVEAEIAKLATRNQGRRAEELDRLAERRDATLERKDEVKRTATERKRQFDERVAAIDGELSKLGAAYRTAAAHAEAAALTVNRLNAEIVRQEVSTGIVDPSGAGGGRRGGIGTAFANIVAARDQAAGRYTLLSNQAAEARRRAEALLAERAVAVARYEAETRTLVAKSDALRKWEGILEKQAGETAAAKDAEPPAAKAIRRRLADFDAYLPFDLDAERDRVVASFHDAP